MEHSNSKTLKPPAMCGDTCTVTSLVSRFTHADFARRWLGPIVIIAVGVANAWWSWRKSPDILVDFGQAPYIAWQLATGKTLYTDIAYFQGPFSPYLNAVWFRLFGVGLTTLIVCNLVILCGVTYLLYQILSLISNRLSATIGCITFLVLFAFAQFVLCGNYNFVCPYAHESTHGIALSLVGIWCLSLYLRRNRSCWIAWAGVSLGLVFLTRVEMFLATFLAMTTGLGLIFWCEKPRTARLMRVVGLFVGCACVPTGAWLCIAMP